MDNSILGNLLKKPLTFLSRYALTLCGTTLLCFSIFSNGLSPLGWGMTVLGMLGWLVFCYFVEWRKQ